MIYVTGTAVKICFNSKINFEQCQLFKQNSICLKIKNNSFYLCVF